MTKLAHKKKKPKFEASQIRVNGVQQEHLAQKVRLPNYAVALFKKKGKLSKEDIEGLRKGADAKAST